MVLVPLVVVSGMVAVYFSTGLITSAFSAVVVWLLDVSVGAVVGVATAGKPSGPDTWSLMASIGKGRRRS